MGGESISPRGYGGREPLYGACETTQRGKELERRGRSIRDRLVAGLQNAYGVESFELLNFGVQPRLQQKRKRLTQEEKEAQERLEALEKAAAEAGLKV